MRTLKDSHPVNVGVAISSPVSGNTFSCTFGQTTNSVMYTVTVSSADAAVTGTKAKATGQSGSTATSTSTGATESDTKPEVGSSLLVPLWSITSSVGALILWIL